MHKSFAATDNLEQVVATEEDNIMAAKQAIEVFNTGDISRVSEFMSPEYINVASKSDPIRGQLKWPAEFIDTVKNLRSALIYYSN